MTGLGPELPANWYLLGRADDLRRGAVTSHKIGGREVVVWRGRESGTAAAFAAHCAHMGCHLARGDVVGDRLRCGLHHRLIGADGAFGASGLRQPTLPLAEYCGGLWVRLGSDEAVPPLPELGLGDVAACYAGEHRFALPWQVLVANGFDCEHLASVHERRLLAPPILEQAGASRMVLRYHTRPIGKGLSDRITALIGPDGVHGEITSSNGAMMLVRSQIGQRRNFILLSFVPTPEGGTCVRGIVGTQQPRTGWTMLQARIAARLFKAFLYKDLSVLDGLAWHEPLHEDSIGDRFTRELCDFFRRLPDA
jgi:phenylpropionate dioxygenase-like ring-hydroxylating dioxygenase large terminal subunit